MKCVLALLVIYFGFIQVDSQTEPNVCVGVPTGTMVINPESCTTYYFCQNGGGILVRCPEDLWYNPRIQDCDRPEIAGCHLFGDIEDGISCPSIDNPFVIQFIPSLIECERYYICYHGWPVNMRCLAGFYWNQVTKQCDYPMFANCALDPAPIETICSRSASGRTTILPHPTECELYFYCTNGVAQVQQCPFLLHFDYKEQECIVRERAHCYKNRNN